MRKRTALKVRIGDTIHMKPEVGARSYTVTEIEYDPSPRPSTGPCPPGPWGVRYPLFKTKNDGSFTYLLVRIAQNKKGQVIV